MNPARPMELMPMYRRQERGRQETVKEVEQLKRRVESRPLEPIFATDFERIEAERPLVAEALQRGSLLPFLEVREEQARARWQAQVEQLKKRYTHARLEADLKKAFTIKQARVHAQKIHEAIMAHPEILSLLRQGRPIRQEGNRVIIGTHVLQAMLKAAELRRRFHDALIGAGAKPGNTVRRLSMLRQRGFQRKAA